MDFLDTRQEWLTVACEYNEWTTWILFISVRKYILGVKVEAEERLFFLSLKIMNY